jgi:histidinol-phosphatase (PHP family)
MKALQNLHTHSKYCDGRDTPEEMIAHALSKGFDSIGFSGHSYMSFSPDYSMSVEGTEEYKKEIKELKRKYAGEIDVFLGLEFEMHSEVELAGYDYLIGSLHYFKIGGEYVGFDRSADEVKRVIDVHFGGDGLRFARKYYEKLCTLPEYGSFDILGHFDIITKNIEKVKLFDIESKEYKTAAVEAIDALKGKIPFFEVNTGAISRGYRTSPYPTIDLIKEFRSRGFGAVISSDCHDGRYLDCGFEDARELLKEGGFTERYILTDNGFKAVAI